MKNIGLFRCQDNEHKCPLTSCIRSIEGCRQGFASYEQARLVGVFALQADLENNLALADILKQKGADTIHFVTCAFCHKDESKTWHLGNGFFEGLDDLAKTMTDQTGLPCVKGSAHLPSDYQVEQFNPRM